MKLPKLIFRQLFDRNSCTYTYLVGDEVTKQALLIDPVLELVSRDLKLVEQLGLTLKYVLNTHVHADHVTGSGNIKSLLNNQVKSVISRRSHAKADILVEDDDEISCGSALKLKVLNTPGHTDGCVTYVDIEKRFAFTGDALLIRGCGRTDFQEGSASTLFDSVWNKILSLPDECALYPAHDYNGQSVTSVKEEKLFNPRLTKAKSEFIKIMNNLNLDKPKLIDVAVPKNLVCGV